MILSATVTNLLLFDMAVWSFQVQVQSDVMNQGAFLSRLDKRISLVPFQVSTKKERYVVC